MCLLKMNNLNLTCITTTYRIRSGISCFACIHQACLDIHFIIKKNLFSLNESKLLYKILMEIQCERNNIKIQLIHNN